MSKSPVQFATALLLAAVYAVVGGTGPALHYLVSGDAPGIRSTEGKSSHRQGYFHCHGPDYHWHYHSWEVDEEQGEDDLQPTPDGAPTYRALHHPHQPHACPALAVVANMKLGAGLVEVLPSSNPTRGLLRQVGQRLHASTSSSPHLPRGPPYSRVA